MYSKEYCCLFLQLTSLVSSFYTVLNKNFLDAIFLKQIREIGFLVEYESLLSSLGKICSNEIEQVFLNVFIVL